MWRWHGLVWIFQYLCQWYRERRICDPSSGVSETSLCSEQRKQKQLPKAQKWSGHPHSPSLMQVPDNQSSLESLGQGTDVSFPLNFSKKLPVTNQVWSCCGFVYIITLYISISKLMVLIFRIKFWNWGFSISYRNYFP